MSATGPSAAVRGEARHFAKDRGAADPRLGHEPALDGARGLAILGVLLYQGTSQATPGGFLGVDLFFVLSGYLITSRMLGEHQTTGRIDLWAFWRRRARRLAPALLPLFAWLPVYAAFVADPEQLDELRRDALATLAGVANWRLVAVGEIDVGAMAAPSPLDHLWSLGIQEQWYVLWPVLLLVLLRYLPRRRLPWAVVALAVSSAVWMAVLHDPQGEPSRVQFGTDTRAQSLLLGALVGLTAHRWVAAVTDRSHQARVASGYVGLAGFVAMVGFVDDTDRWIYEGGSLLVAAFCVALIAGLTAPAPRNHVRAIGSWAPLVAIGTISYALYLWHWPVYVLLTPERTGIQGDALLLFRLAVTLVTATASYVAVERPVRTRRWPRHVTWLGFAVAASAVVFAVVLATRVETRSVVAGTPSDLAATGAASAPGTGTPVLLVGDSVAFGLGWNRDPAQPDGLAVLNGGIVGCGIVSGEHRPGNGEPPVGDYPCEERLTRWRNAVDQLQPAVSVILGGAYEVYDHEVDGERLAFGSDAYREFLLEELQQDVATLTSRGGQVMLLNVQCMDPVDNGLGPATPERGEATRVDWLNAVFASFAKDAGPTVHLVDLHDRLCPDGYQGEIDGERLHRDGVHFTPEGANAVWRWLAPQIAALATPDQ